jgi:hypothetical protein
VYKLNAVDLTHSLKPPGFNHRTYHVRNLVSSLWGFEFFNLYRYPEAPAPHGRALHVGIKLTHDP